jgi:hypothetical protein
MHDLIGPVKAAHEITIASSTCRMYIRAWRTDQHRHEPPHARQERTQGSGTHHSHPAGLCWRRIARACCSSMLTSRKG